MSIHFTSPIKNSYSVVLALAVTCANGMASLNGIHAVSLLLLGEIWKLNGFYTVSLLKSAAILTNSPF